MAIQRCKNCKRSFPVGSIERKCPHCRADREVIEEAVFTEVEPEKKEEPKKARKPRAKKEEKEESITD